MTAIQRFFLLLSSPDDATYDVYDAPNIGHAFAVVTAYAFFSSFNSFLSASIKSESIGLSMLAFIGSFFAAYLTWVFLTIIFHIAAEFWGGLGELPNAAAFVGMAAAPLVLTSILSIFLTIIGSIALAEDPDSVLPKVSLGLSLFGMAWGWPGILCYFGLKNGERLHEAKAATIALVVFLAFAIYELSSSSAL